MNNREIAEKIFYAGIRGVLPEKIINGIMSVTADELVAGNHKFSLDEYDNIYVIGAGKASAAMGHYVECLLGEKITGGHIVVKYGHSCKLKKIKITEAGHPLPDMNGFGATEKILNIVSKADERDLVICLISGGGSSLLADLPGGLLPEELYIVNNLLIRCGASIGEINCVRKHLSAVKGGQLARLTFPATLISLILSDVTGNSPDIIASGPTVPDPSTFSDAAGIIGKYNLSSGLTAGIIKYLKNGLEGSIPETPKPGDPVFNKTYNIIAGTNLNAIDAASVAAHSYGFSTFIIDSEIKGDVATVARQIYETALAYRNNTKIRKPACLLYGGETTVKVTGSGDGGRNQHLALSVAVLLKDVEGITFLSAGTDGTDGPTSSAGAVVDSMTMENAALKKLDPEKYLEEFDSFNFFRIAGGHIITGPTFTNVMDLMVVLIE